MVDLVPTPQDLYNDFKRDGSFRQAALTSYALLSAVPFPRASLECNSFTASFVLFPLCRAGWSVPGATPLAELTAFAAAEPGDSLVSVAGAAAWAPRAIGRASGASWRGAGAAAAIAAEMRLAAFLGLRAVLVPLPEGADEEAAAAAVIAAHLRSGRDTAVWVTCDAATAEHREAFTRLRLAAVWGGGSNVDVTAVSHALRSEAVNRIAPFLQFSSTCGALPAEWLGEPVAAFEVPEAQRMALSLRTDDDGRIVRMPTDLVSSSAALWATTQQPFVSFGTFIVELLRRRALPVFGADFFFDCYAMINHLYISCVAHEPRDHFACFEDVLQLPLQPLGHMLPSGVYETFERDSAKYTQYNSAMYAYFSEWDDTRSHAHLCDVKDSHPTRTAFVVLLGAGRGPLISECFDAATRAGIRVRLFAIEKNPEAADVVSLRLRGDMQWRKWCEVDGHSVSVVPVDARELRGALSSLPTDFGLCDLLVSELLGSFGDNELSPECIDGFYAELRAVQRASGLPANPHVVSIPSSYTAHIAPLHSGRFEEAVAEASVRGPTVRPTECIDRHAAFFHSMFVSNTCAGVALAPPQPCWTFEHVREEPQEMVREATLRFAMASAGRLSGFIGFFTAVLYESRSGSPRRRVTIATTADERTPDMFSWFPSLFALEPRDTVEVKAGDEVRLTMWRNVNLEKQRVWYSYQSFIHRGPEKREQTRSALINNDGWAASILLSS